MPAPEAAVAYDLRQRTLAAATARAVDRLWQRIAPRDDFAAAWDLPGALRLLTGGQAAAARDAVTYLRQVLPQVGLPDDPVAELVPAAFAGVASDGRDLAGLLEQPVIRARVAGGGLPGLAAGRAQLRMIVVTQLADAARESVQVGIVARPGVGGYVRMLTPPSCGRCAILAGRWYRWNASFLRHEHCDCRGIPSSEDRAGDLRTDPAAVFRSGQVTGLTRAEASAIRDGADPGQVVNARRGMSTASAGGQRVQVTSEGTTRHGYASAVRRALGRTAPRLTPGEIYRQAGGDREQAVRLLTVNGYLLPARGQGIRGLAGTVA